MNAQDPAHLLEHILWCMPRGIWHALEVAVDYHSLNANTSGSPSVARFSS